MRASMLLFALVLGCGATARGPDPLGSQEPVLDVAAGVHLLALPRPTPGRVWLSLWIDAGARDASPPQLATIAAWAASDGIDGRALADAIEFSLPCEASTLTSCMGRLARAIGTRAVEDDLLTAALERAQRARETTAGDVARSSDRLALEALLGGAVDPLGDPADDAGLDGSAVEAFLADHFGPNRALIVAVGDVDTDTLRSAAEQAFADAPRAERERASRDAPSRAGRAEIGNADALSLASVFRSPSAALSAARRWVARVGGGAEASVFPVRGGTALLLRRRGPLQTSLEATARDMVDRLREVREEPEDFDLPLPTPEDARSLARWHGARWASGAAAEAEGMDFAVGIGAVIDGGRADQVSESLSPDATRRARAMQALSNVLETNPTFEGSVEEDRASLTLENGVEIRAIRLAGTENAAVTVLFEGGAREETARAHGVTALLALVSARACSSTAPQELGAHPSALGITVTPHVSPERFGLTVSGPRARWPQISYLAARCARVRSVDTGLIETARLDLPPPPGPEHALALAISADAPGRITTTPVGIPATGAELLLRWRDRVAVGARTWIGVAGDVPLQPVVHRLARIAGRYPSGEAAEADAWRGPPNELTAQSSDTTGAWIIRSTPGDQSLSRVVAAFAAHAIESLRQTPLRVIAEQHGIFGGHAIVAIFVQADEAGLTQLPMLVPAITGEPVIPPARPDPSMPTPSSLALARGIAPGPEANAARAAWQRLSAARPSFVVLRPGR